ncbi:MAG TPA: nickel-responsive transcriptional regulator NikR [Pyrinomonadaceae bacterium]|nr:nickel-responsive transcriptional regulator NikR [Pyrinomonadaceae bacterium]
MSDLIRFGVSIEKDLLDNFDNLIAVKNYATRSEALRDLIRESLIEQKIDNHSETKVLGSLTLIYDHHASNLLQEMANVQHQHHELILSVMHLHVSHDDCMEVIALSGKVNNITELANNLVSLKGIKNGKLFLTLPSSNIIS